MQPDPWEEDEQKLLAAPETLWPKGQLTISPLVPSDLQRAYEEARTCFTARAYMAAAVMVRRTLEGVCAERGVTAKALMTGHWVIKVRTSPGKRLAARTLPTL